MQVALGARRSPGFTMVEMIVSIVVLGVLSVALAGFIMPAINANQSLERRAALVEATESALRRVARDVRISLPNSVRTTNVLAVGSGFALELIPTADGGRYCTSGTADCGPTGLLTVGSATSAVDILGCYRNTAFAPAGLPAATTAYRLAMGSTDSNIYTATGTPAVITPAGNTLTVSLFPNTGTLSCGSPSATATSANRHRVTLTTASHTFPTASPRQRLYVIEDAAAPVTYICNATAGTLTRYSGYKNGSAYSTAAQPTNPGAAPLSGATGRLVTNNVSACSATSVEANIQTSGIVVLSLSLSSSGETVQLSSQVQLDNSQ